VANKHRVSRVFQLYIFNCSINKGEIYTRLGRYKSRRRPFRLSSYIYPNNQSEMINAISRSQMHASTFMSHYMPGIFVNESLYVRLEINEQDGIGASFGRVFGNGTSSAAI